jgi:DNA-binding phage protein
MNAIEKIHKTRNKVLRRQKILEQANSEFERARDEYEKAVKIMNKSHKKVLRRQKILEEAFRENDEVVNEGIAELEALAKSQKLSVTKIAELTGISRSSIYTLGADYCRSYYDIWNWVKVNRPELVQQLERNYEREFLNQ